VNSKENKKKLFLSLSLVWGVLFSSCFFGNGEKSAEEKQKEEEQAEIPDPEENPLAKNCTDQGGELLVKNSLDGQKFVLCKFKDGVVKEIRDMHRR